MESLKKNKDFKVVYKYGKSIATKHLVLYYLPNRSQVSRVGFSISKKIGKAVVRNKLKRRLREIIRLEKNIKEGYDLIFIARQRVHNLNYQGLKKDVRFLLEKAGLYQL